MAKLPTVAFVSDAIYPYNKGGKETRLYEISTRLAARGYNVHVYSMQWWKGSKDRTENGVLLHGICPYIPLYDGHRRSIKQGVLFGLSCLKLITAKFDVIDVDHMPFFPIYFVRLVCWLRGKKMHATWHEVWGPEYWETYLPGTKGRIASLIERFSVLLPDKITCISLLTAEKLHTILNVPKQKISVVACGYDPNAIAESSVSKENSDVIYVGRLLEHKHVDVLIEAIGELKKTKPNILCRIVGVGPEERRLVALVKKLKLSKNVIFHKELEDHHDVFSLMKASKVFVLPSTREGFGIVVMEANACGLPVITIDHPDNAAKEIGQVKMELDAKEIAQKILELLSKPQPLSDHTKKILKSYTWDKIANELIKSY